MRARSVLVVLFGALIHAAAGCDDTTPDLTQWCPDDPTVQWCPQGDCPGQYQCLSYCVVYYPDGGTIPESGMGAWCDDPRLPDYGTFCADHLEDVHGCSDWCAAHEGRCEGGSDGDSDSDTDADIDDADPDVDPDPEPECTTHDQCLAADEAQCDPGTGTCVACTEDAHCAHLPGTPACDGGVCYACSATNETQCTGSTTHCLAAEHRCVGCTDDAHCPDVAAARCDATTHECAPCTDDTPCARFTEAPHCDGSTCVQCTSYAHCDIAAGRVCNYTTHLCVNACEPCSGDATCTAALGEGFRCVSDWVGVNHCLQLPPPTGCERPWMERELFPGPPNVCAPPESTSCLGIVEFGQRGICPPTDACGENVPGGDGYCVEGGESYCSYYCTDTDTSSDCPTGATCSGVPQVCRLP